MGGRAVKRLKAVENQGDQGGGGQGETLISHPLERVREGAVRIQEFLDIGAAGMEVGKGCLRGETEAGDGVTEAR